MSVTITDVRVIDVTPLRTKEQDFVTCKYPLPDGSHETLDITVERKVGITANDKVALTFSAQGLRLTGVFVNRTNATLKFNDAALCWYAPAPA